MKQRLVASQSQSYPRPLWRVSAPAPPEVLVPICRELGVPPLVASVLWSRGFRSDVSAVLAPALEPSAIPTLDEAAATLERTLLTGSRVLIHGDYDADGISGTAILTIGLRALGGDVTPYLPNRLTDGYGIHPERVANHAEEADLLITVDCGITNLKEIRSLKAAGVEVIVTDHHQPGPELPNCLVVHPRIPQTSPGGHSQLTGAGVAFHLLWALHRRLGLEPPHEYADIAMLGTVADVAPLLGENRALVREGLKRLGASLWPGLRASLVQAGLRHNPTARDVAFVLAPRLNAAGRFGEAEIGLELLTTSSERRGRELAAYLDARNADRRRIQDDMFRQALELADPEAPALVLGHDSWHPGVIGVVASKLVDAFFRPVFIVAKGKGSVRSTPGISAVAALSFAAKHLISFGGHEGAAGFAIEGSELEAFKKTIYTFVRRHPTPQPTVEIDTLISADEIGSDLYRSIQELEPFGEGHPAPAFALSGELEAARAVGVNGNTLQLRIGGVKGIAWSKGELARKFPAGLGVNVAISLRENLWREKRSVEFVATEIRLGKPLEVRADRTPISRILRGRPKSDSGELKDPWNLPTSGETVWVRRLPLDDPAAPFVTSKILTQLIKCRATLHFDLTPEAIRKIRHYADSFPSVADLRQSFVCLKREQPLPFDEAKQILIRQALEELGLFDELGRLRSGQKRNPYLSDSLMKGLLEQYRLRGFLKAYLAADDAGFAITVATLFG